MSVPIGSQLYTLRDEVARDLPGTLEAVADLGFAGVELWPEDRRAEPSGREFARHLVDVGLSAAGSHIWDEHLVGDGLEQMADFCAEVGAPFAVYSGGNFGRTAADYDRLTDTLAAASIAYRERGIDLAFHGEEEDMRPLADGRSAVERIADTLGEDVLAIQVDVYWAHVGGLDPVELIRRLGRRVASLHLKDHMAPDSKPFVVNGATWWTCEVGEGVIAIAGAAEAARESARWWLVEQDYCRGEPLDSLRTSLENLRRMGLA
jgi:sugar phosphate isomerase/epimerase